jgi:hypothetical protein
VRSLWGFLIQVSRCGHITQDSLATKPLTPNPPLPSERGAEGGARGLNRGEQERCHYWKGQ